MSRIRTIKPEFPQSESVGKLSRDARLLFIELWTVADDSGRSRAASRMLASLLFPYDDDARDLMDGWLDELEGNGFIRRYEADGSSYLEICNWLKHQKIDRPSPSRIPEFRDGLAKAREASRIPREASSRLRTAVFEDAEKASVSKLRQAVESPEIQGGFVENIELSGFPRESSRGLAKDLGPCTGTRKYSDPVGSGANAPLPVDDPKQLLFTEGLRWFQTLMPESAERVVRGLIGKMLKGCGGDTHAGKLWGIIQDARRERKADAIAWIWAVIDSNKPRDGPAKPRVQNAALLSYLEHPRIFDDEPSAKDSGNVIDHEATGT